MEIPTEIKSLYRHWEYHTQRHIPAANQVGVEDLQPLQLTRMIEFATLRMQIWEQKTLGTTPPYTTDNILSIYRFCNIYRELDKQTIEIHKLLNPLRDDFNLWLLNLAFNRLLCNPGTFQQVGQLSFDVQNNIQVMHKLLALPKPKYGSAYVFPISVIQRSEFNTREKFFTMYLPTVIPRIADKLKTLKSASVVAALAEILPLFGFNLKFHWTEILIDVAYQYPEIVNLFASFPVGPGSIPTMRSLANLPPTDTVMQLMKIKLPDFPYLEYNGKSVWLSAENWEGIGCEFRKYTNLKNGTGRRRIYKKGRG